MITACLPSKVNRGKRRSIVLNSSDCNGTAYIRSLNLAADEYAAIKKAFLKEALKRAYAPSSKKIIEEIKNV